MRVEPAEVEAVLGTHPSVAACAVVPVPGPDGLTARLAAFVVPFPGAADAAPAHWRRHVGRHFGSTLLPLTCRPVEDLPRGAGGKVDRRRLLARAVLASPPAAPAAGPSQEGHP
jgi:(S)-beta-tyrosine adenylation enzyme